MCDCLKNKVSFESVYLDIDFANNLFYAMALLITGYSGENLGKRELFLSWADLESYKGV